LVFIIPPKDVGGNGDSLRLYQQVLNITTNHARLLLREKFLRAKI